MNSEKQSGMKKHLFTLLVAIFIAMGTQAQTLDSKFGIDSVQTLRNASVYGQLVKQKRYAEALPAWRYVFVNAPKFQKRTYTKGVSIMRYMAKKDPKYVDSLMMVYDQRIKYYGNDRKYPTAWILGRKGNDCFKYKKKTVANMKEAYTYLSESISKMGDVAEGSVINNAMVISVKLFDKDALTKEDVLTNFSKYMNILDKQYEVTTKEKYKKKIDAVRSNVSSLFFNAGVADCITLAKLLTPKFEASEDLKELKSIISLLKRAECVDSELFAKVAERIYKIEPSASSAYSLAIFFQKRQEYGKTEKYIEEALSLVTDAKDKSEYLVKLATIKYSQKKYAQVKSNCNKALAINPKMGEAYILIGKAYANSSKSYSKDAFDQHTVFWVAVDKFIKAKKVDPSVKEEANKLIKVYSPHFPSKNEAFFRSITPGKTVKVGSWINETTTARFND